MQPRTLDQIIGELNSTYQPQIASIEARRAALPGQLQAEEQGLQAKQGQAYEDILAGARRRGVAAGGIPLGEQAKYSATEYMPALARMRGQFQETSRSLDDSISSIFEKRNTFAHQLKQNEDQLFESRRQFDAQQAFAREQQAAQLRAAAAAAASGPMPTLGAGPGNNPKSATATQRGDKGWAFTSASGQPISAAAYAQAKGIPFRQLLQTMANQGDAGAKAALGFVGDDYGYDPRKIGNNVGLYNQLVWGTGKQAANNPISIAQPRTGSISLGMPNNPRLM